MRPSAALWASFLIFLAAGCGASQAPLPSVAVTMPAPEAAPTIDEATYQAVLTTVFEEFLADVRALGNLDDRSALEAGILIAPYARPRLADRMTGALEHHGVSAREMAGFAIAHPDVVQRVNGQNAARMREAKAELHGLMAHVRARNAEGIVAANAP